MAIDLGPVLVDLAVSPPRTAAGTPTRFSSRVHSTVAEAASDTPLTLKEPGFLPGESTLLDITVIKEPKEMVVLTYEDPANRTSVVVVLSPVDATKKATHFSIGDRIEEATVLGKPAAIIELESHPEINSPKQTTVVWVGEGVVYQAVGVSVSREELFKVAESF